MSDIRQKIIAEARSWLRTPYHHHGRVRGVGVDCAMLPAEVYAAVGLMEPLVVDVYSPQWHLHRSEEKYLAQVQAHGREVAKPLAGDFVLFKVGRCWAHGAIVLDWPLIIHASADAKSVVLADASRDAFAKKRMADRDPRFFSLIKEG